MRGLRLCLRTFLPTPATQKGAAMGGLRFYLRTPLPTPETQGRIGRAAVLPANSHVDPPKRGEDGGAAALPANLHVVPRKKKKRNRKRKDKKRKEKKKGKPATKVPSMRDSLLVMIKVGCLGACVAFLVLVSWGIACFAAVLVLQVKVFGA